MSRMHHSPAALLRALTTHDQHMCSSQLFVMYYWMPTGQRLSGCADPFPVLCHNRYYPPWGLTLMVMGAQHLCSSLGDMGHGKCLRWHSPLQHVLTCNNGPAIQRLVTKSWISDLRLAIAIMTRKPSSDWAACCVHKEHGTTVACALLITTLLNSSAARAS
jgi:hypothetical protein